MLVLTNTQCTCEQFEFHGKNAAIRRAIGSWTLLTNTDIFLSDHLARWLGERFGGPAESRRALDHHKFYRALRVDMERPLRADTPPALFWPQCRRTAFRLGRVGWESLREHDEAGADFWRSHDERLARWRSGDEAAVEEVKEGASLRMPAELALQASGDFTLLRTEHLLRIRGHPELASYAMHDSALLGCAVILGQLGQVLLSEPLLLCHQPHSRAKTTALPATPAASLFNLMLRRSQHIQPNSEHWGLTNCVLPDEYHWRGAWYDIVPTTADVRCATPLHDNLRQYPRRRYYSSR
jgi:hypothetical protein